MTDTTLKKFTKGENMKNIKWGIIGLGGIANKFAQAITKMENTKLIAVASRTKEKSEIFGTNYEVAKEKCYGSYEEIVKDPDVDAIYIALPNSLHKELSLLCLKNKKAVLCEKPVTMNEKEVIEVINCAKENNVFFMEAMKTRFLPVHKEVKRIIDNNELGEVRLIQADFGFFSEFDEANRLFHKELGGGALLDVGVYPISYGMWILGNKPEKVLSSYNIGLTGVDENVSAIIKYKSGQEIHIYGAINLNTAREATIVGTKGIIKIPRFSSGDKLKIFINNEEKTFEFPFSINGFEYQIEEVNKSIRNNEIQSKIMSFEDSIAVMRVLDIIKNQA